MKKADAAVSTCFDLSVCFTLSSDEISVEKIPV